MDRSVSAGYCGMGENIIAARASLHMWEEPCISKENGSGAVFFSGCTLRCAFCQNHDIAVGKSGKEISVKRLSEIFLELQEKKANNINLVTPTHFVPWIAKALEIAKLDGLRIPIVYNTGTYENVETLKMMDGLVDVYLPDMKYKDDRLAIKYSNARNYFNVAMKALEEMYSQVGNPEFFSDDEAKVVKVEPDTMKKGIIVRHLLLPGHLDDSKEVIKALYEKFKDSIYISIMNQYTPMEGIKEKFPKLGRTVSDKEYEELVGYAIDLGIVNGFVQENGTAKESFIPAFDYTGI